MLKSPVSAAAAALTDDKAERADGLIGSGRHLRKRGGKKKKKKKKKSSRFWLTRSQTLIIHLIFSRCGLLAQRFLSPPRGPLAAIPVTPAGAS